MHFLHCWHFSRSCHMSHSLSSTPLGGDPAAVPAIPSSRSRRALGCGSPGGHGGAAGPSCGQGANTHSHLSLITGCLLKPGLPSLAESEQPLRAPPGSLPAGRGGDAPRCSFSSSQARRWLSQRFWEGLFLLSTSSERGSVIPTQRG